MTDFWAILEGHAVDSPRATALDDGIATVGYGELLGRVAQRVEEIDRLGVTRLAIDLDNGIDWIVWDLACARAGVTCIPLPPFFLPTQKRHAIDAAGVDAVVTLEGIERRRPGTAPELPAATAKITFTSGSTGAPKGVCLPWSGLVEVAASIVEVLDTARLERHYSALPLGILLENVAGVYTALMAGSTVVVGGNADCWQDPAQLARALAATGADSVILVPELLRGLMAVLAASGQRLDDLEFVAVGGATVAASLVVAARRLGLPVYEGYGLSECGSVVSLNRPGVDRPGTAGALLPHVSARVVGGELVIENPAYLGYLGQPAASSLATGDLVEFDEDGFVSVRGRSNNLLVTSWGRNLSPEWIESELLSHPEIRQAMVFGDGLPQPRALVSTVEGVDHARVAEIVAAANRRLPRYAQIERWRLVPPFTAANGALTGNGRLRRSHIIDSVVSEGDAPHESAAVL